MKSLRVPKIIVAVPNELIMLSEKRRGVACNLRLAQRPQGQLWPEDGLKSEWRDEKIHLYRPFIHFFKGLYKGDKLIVCFQTGDGEYYSITDKVEQISWDDGFYPQVCFAEQCLWGAYILAIAKIKPNKSIVDEGKRHEGFGLFFRMEKDITL